jgi:serine protease Do
MLIRLFLSAALVTALAGPALAADVVPQSRAAIHLSFAPVVKRVAPAVVNVFSRRVIRSTLGPGSIFNDPLFQRFFGNMAPFGGLGRERVQNSLGSGVIVDPSGLIVTNRHVIEGADQIHVVLSDRREFDAKVILSDERADLAVLRIDAPGGPLPTLPLGDSDALEVGDLVLAVGDPFGVGQTVTMGIVSGLARSLGTDYGSFIQTDAAINPGNSGGPLVDLDGRMVGINTAIFSQSGGSVGIGFAIPVNMVRGVIEAARHGGHVTRPWLGASGQTVTPALARDLRLPVPEGVLIKDVAAGGPAAAAGIRDGDVVLSVDGHDVGSPDELRFRIATLASHAHATLALWRDGHQRAVTVALTPPPENPPRDVTRMDGREPFGGATVANLNPALDAELGLDDSESGVIVRQVPPRSIAQEIGLAEGDIVLAVNNQEVDSVAALRRAVAGAGPWRVAIQRQGQRLAFTVGQ